MQTAIKLISAKLVRLPPTTLAILAQLRQHRKSLRNRKFKIRASAHSSES